MGGASSEKTAVVTAPRPPLAGGPDTATIDPHALRLGDRRLAVGAAASGWRQRRPWPLVAGFAAIALVLRLLLVRGIWVDEAISVHLAHMSLPGMLDQLRQADVHPPLYFLTLWGTVRVLGFGELAVHAPSIIAGTLLVPVLFLAGRELFDRRTGMVAAALGACAPLLIWYSQEARSYALVMLLMTLSVWAQSRAIRDGRARYWAAYTGFNVALLYTHYFTLIPIGIEQLAFAAVAWRRSQRGESVRGLLLACWASWLVLVIAVAPLASFAYQQFAHNAATGFTRAPAESSVTAQSGGGGLSVYAVLSNLIWAVWGYHADSTMLRVAALWPLLMLLALAVLGKGRSPATLLVFALAIGSVAAMFLVGLFKRELFEVRYFAGAVPMFILLCARAVTSISPRRAPVLVATGLLFATVLAACADQQLSSNNPRDYDFRGALTSIHDQARPGDTLLYAPGYLRDVVDYYAPGIRARPLGARSPSGKGRVFLMASFLDTPGVAKQVGAARYELAREHGRPLHSKQLEKIRVWEYR